MDQIGLSLKLRRLAAWLDGRCQPDSLIRKQLHGAPFGDCYVTIDPDRQGPFASFNLNRVYLCGTEAGMGPDSVGRLIELFAAEGVKRFFVWLSPGPDMDAVRGWLEASGLSRIRRTGYPTLCRDRRFAGRIQDRSRSPRGEHGRHRTGPRSTGRHPVAGICEVRG